MSASRKPWRERLAIVTAVLALAVVPASVLAGSGWKYDRHGWKHGGAAWRHPGGPKVGESCTAATERAVNGYIACLLQAESRSPHVPGRRGRLQPAESCLKAFEKSIRWADRRHAGACPEIDDTQIAAFACTVSSGVSAFVAGEQDELQPAACGSDETNLPGETEGPIVFDLESGVSTVTGPYPGGFGSCGADQSYIDAHYPGFRMAAIPAAFFSKYLQTGNVACDASLKVATDSSGEPLCYELSSLDGTIMEKVIVADVCAGNCSANVASCVSGTPEPSCSSTTGSASCLDCPDASIQFESKWRCPPAMACFDDANPGTDWETYTDGFTSSTLGITPSTQCSISGYIPSGDFPSFVDWCSGENAHFDIQAGNPFDLNPTVINYQRIPCTSS